MKNALALGSFDGVHLGHKAVLELPNGLRHIAVTFSVPPKFKSFESSLILTENDKEMYFKELGIDEIFSLDFEEIRNVEALNFLDFLKNKFNPAFISFGFNYRFGKDALGDTKLLKDYCESNNIEYKCVNAVECEDGIISSTNIRKLLSDGMVSEASKLLYKPFSFCEKVISGDKRGRTIGFPTINQRYPKELVRLKFGVYKSKVLFDGKEYAGITDIGIRPTFETDYVISETYIKNFSGNLYGKNVRVVPIEFLREEMKFSSVEELKKQITIDLKK